MPSEWRTVKALVHKIRLHGRRGKGMAKSFNELDVQHGWEEITHTHVYKGYKHSTHCAMIRAQYEYKYGKYRYIPRAGHARISLNTVHKIRIHGRLGKGMAESFNEHDVQHGWEEITLTHVYKGYKHSTHCAMIHAQYEYKYEKDRYIPRAGHARISLNTVDKAHAQYTLCNGTITIRVKTRANKYTVRACHAKPLYKGYTHSTHCAIVHAQLRVQKLGRTYITRAGHARPLYKRYKHGTHCAIVQPQYELKHGSISTRPVLAMLNHCTRPHSTHCAIVVHAQLRVRKLGKMYITRAGHARPLYKRYKHGTHCAMVQSQYE